MKTCRSTMFVATPYGRKSDNEQRNFGGSGLEHPSAPKLSIMLYRLGKWKSVGFLKARRYVLNLRTVLCDGYPRTVVYQIAITGIDT